jgi:hypothetical protein
VAAAAAVAAARADRRAAPGAARRPHPRPAAARPFLAIASAGGLPLVFVWRAQLGVVDDWNLYALAAQPLGLLVLGWLATEPQLRTRAPWITVTVVLAATHTAAWIAENHTPVTG